MKKASAFTQDLGKKAGGAAKKVGEAAESLGKSGAFRTAATSAATIKEEIEGHSLGGKVYRAPKKLRKRKELQVRHSRNLT